MGGTVLAVVFSGVIVMILFIIGCTLAHSLSSDVDEVLSSVVESGRTCADAIIKYNVFEVVSHILLKTRFVLSPTADYFVWAWNFALHRPPFHGDLPCAPGLKEVSGVAGQSQTGYTDNTLQLALTQIHHFRLYQ
jgi:hypothetical protein